MPGRLDARLDRLQDPFLLLVRLVWGISFFTFGLNKLVNLGQTAETFAALGVPAASLNAVAVGLVEGAGGLCLALGWRARIAAAPLVGVMLVAYFTAHAAEPFTQAKPYPYLVASLLVLVFGPGAWSLDGARARKQLASDDPVTD